LVCFFVFFSFRAKNTKQYTNKHEEMMTRSL
jgi:hypothetical protein